MTAQRSSYENDIAQVRRTGEEKAKRQYLDSQFIRGAKIAGIGNKLATLLAAADIETALDIDNRVYAVSGIGNRRALDLFAWRGAVERRFRFEPRMIDGLTRDVRTRHVQQRTHGRSALVNGAKLLRETVAQVEGRAPEVRARAIQDRRLLDQAEANLRPFSALLFR